MNEEQILFAAAVGLPMVLLLLLLTGAIATLIAWLFAPTRPRGPRAR